MKLLIRRFLIFSLSVFLIFAPAVSYAASPVGWSASPIDVVINGVNATITAVKGSGASALQSTVRHAPAAANIGKKILKGAGAAAVLMAVTQILGDGVDWVLDPANNAVKYKVSGGGEVGDFFDRANFNGQNFYMTSKTVEPLARGYYEFVCNSGWNNGYCNPRSFSCDAISCKITGYDGYVRNYKPSRLSVAEETKYAYLPIATVAAKVQSNSVAGHAPSQDLIRTVAIDDVNEGVLDVPLNVNAIPVADAPPVTDPNAPPRDPTLPAPPFDPSSIIAAIKSVMAAVVNMSGILGAKIDILMIDLGIKQAESIAANAANTADIVAANDRTGALVAQVTAAIEAIEGNTMDGQVINDAVDRAIAAADAAAVASDAAADARALEGRTADDARALEGRTADDARALEAEAAADARALEAIEADDARAKAKADADADAAAADLEAIEADAADANTEVIIDAPVDDFDTDKAYITFAGSCPPDYTASLSIMGNSAPFSFSYTPICTVMSALKPFIVGAGYLAAAYIIAGHSRGSKE